MAPEKIFDFAFFFFSFFFYSLDFGWGVTLGLINLVRSY